ncbi:MAG: hypothetical protein AAF934_08255, partial [Bacteroidota bacterium]
MGCSSCTTNKNGLPKGCKNNGTCGADTCNKLTVFDWLSNMALPGGESTFDCVEVRFKNSRKAFFRNSENLTLSAGDIIATEASPGHDVGIVTLTGELVKVQMKKKKVNWNEETLPKISYDLEALPFPTRRMHELILEATKAGDLEKLRALIGAGDTATQLSFGGFDGDPIDFLKS